MGHYEGIDYTDNSDDFTDITGSEYALDFDEGVIVGAVLDAQFRAKYAAAATEMVKRQAVRALRSRGLTVRQIADRLRLSKSDVARLNRGAPARMRPNPGIDKLVADIWQNGPTATHVTLAERPGDKTRVVDIELNILHANAR